MNSENLNPLTRQFEILNSNDKAALFYLSRDYSKEELVKLAINLQKMIIQEQNDKMNLKKQISNLSQQSPKQFIEESEANHQSQLCDIAIQKYNSLIIQYERLFQANKEISEKYSNIEDYYQARIADLKKQNEEIQKQLFLYQEEIFKAQDKQRFPFPQNTKYEGEFKQLSKKYESVQQQCQEAIKIFQSEVEKKQKNNDQIFENILAQIDQMNQVIEELNQQYIHFQQTNNVKDVQINNVLENHQSLLQLNQISLSYFKKSLALMQQGIKNQERRITLLEKENNKLKEYIQNLIKIGQKEIDENKEFIQSLIQRQNTRFNQSNTNQIIDSYHKFKDTLRLLNVEFYQILLQFSSQGLTISQLQVKFNNQNKLLDIIKEKTRFLQENSPSNFQQLIVLMGQFKEIFNSLKQYIDAQNQLTDVFCIQDKFFESYEKVVQKLQETEYPQLN
ncbi:unnamed protein product [Paramecium octaurelia]|uniref:Uncharacterized protein n=1 Tax=Paramecium octaurelia TaxID=43137 RepID=A0A8S1YPD4_PAROT|nr:unnamed protein product [Paramecium octaurelia]